MTDSLTDVKNLLTQTLEISRRYREIEKVTGSGFNLLQLLRMGHYEVKTHSPVLADLLNPNGSHGQGSTFLELFLQTSFGTNRDFMTNADLISVHEEKHIGGVDNDAATGGRIDIHLESTDGEVLVIENKIYAAEAHQQIDRYLNYIKERPEVTGRVAYLTLFGEDPTSIKGELPEHLLCISYHSTITQWLRLCRKEVATVPTVRESLTIYINLLCALTNQNSD